VGEEHARSLASVMVWGGTCSGRQNFTVSKKKKKK
jgi:hypothetical protein